MSDRRFMDFHSHLDMPVFDETRCSIVQDYFQNHFSRLVTVADAYDPASFRKTLELISLHDQIFAMAGAHPHNADQYSPAIEKELIRFITGNRLIALGEAGLDYHYDLSARDNQIRVFRRQVNIARETGLPLVIHSRTAEPDVLKILEEERFDQPFIFHCYTGSRADAREILIRGGYISVSGIVTFKKAEEVHAVAQMIPTDRIFSETDSPYLAPIPFRGQTNTPLLVQYVAEKIAQLKNISVDELNSAINANFERIFHLPPRAEG